MDAEKQAGLRAQAGDNTHIVQVVDDMGRTVGRDALRAKGYKVQVSSLEPKPKDQL